MLPPPKPSARSTAISRERSATAEYIVLSAPITAPSPITAATMPPSTVISVVTSVDWLRSTPARAWPAARAADRP